MTTRSLTHETVGYTWAASAVLTDSSYGWGWEGEGDHILLPLSPHFLPHSSVQGLPGLEGAQGFPLLGLKDS